MRIQHKNSLEIFEVTEPKQWEYFGMYGYLVVIIDKVFFINCFDNQLEYEDITEDFVFI